MKEGNRVNMFRKNLLPWTLASSALALSLAQGATAAVVGVRVGQHADKTRVVIDMDAPGTHQVARAARGLEVRLSGGVAGGGKAVDFAGAGLVRLVRVDGAGQVMIDAGAPVMPSKVFTLPPDEHHAHHRLVVDLPLQVAQAASASSSHKSAADLWAEEDAATDEPPPQPSTEQPSSTSGDKSAADLWAEEDSLEEDSAAAPTAADSGSLFTGWSFTGFAEVEGRLFPQDSRDPDPKNQTISLAAEPSVSYAWADGNHRLTFTPFGRIDSNDSDRNHADIRELKWIGVFDRLELRAGIDKLFWGVTESIHLVDIINQDDGLEDIDGEDKLGQPLASAAYDSDLGLITGYLLPYFREREFPGADGRPRGPLPITEDVIYNGGGNNKWRLDWALRWSHAFGPVDVAVSHFHGRNRDPVLVPVMTGGGPVLTPRYDIIDQTGIELQATIDALLLKFEGIRRAQPGENQMAAAGGFEYTFYNIMDGASDLGVLAEYLWDDRGRNPDNPFEDDLFVALRWTANDVASTTLLAGAIFDLDTQAKFINIEASRRFGEHWKVSLDARLLATVPVADPLYPFADDDFIQVKLQYYF